MNLIEILQEHKIDYREAGEHQHVAEGWAGTDCPLCSPNSHHFRLGFSLSSAGCNCWSCGKQSAGEMLGMLIGKPANVGWAILGRVERQGFKKKARGKLTLPSGCDELLPAHRQYLKGRGFDPDELAEVYGLMGTGQLSSRPWSLVFPVKEDFETVSYATRKLHDKGTRYLSAEPKNEAVSARELLFAEDMAVNAIAVTEGFFDAMRIGPGAVATMGVAITTAQVRRMARYHRILIVLDNEPDAQKRAHHLCERLSVFGKEVVNVELGAKDACLAPDHELKEIRKMMR